MIITNAPGGGSGDALAIVTVTWPSGSTCTATLGSTVLQWGTSGSGTFKLTKAGTWTIACTNGTKTDSKQVIVTQATSTVALSYLAFPKLSWTEIKSICDSGLAQTYIDNGTWNVGDINTSVNYGSYATGIQLVHCLTDTQRGSSYYNTSGHIVCQFVSNLANSCYRYDESTGQSLPQIYFSGQFHTMCNDTIYNGLDSTFKALLSSWTCIVGKENSTTSAITGIYSQSVYLAAPSAKEVGGTNAYNTDENDACFVFDYYSDSTTAPARRKKTGATFNDWALRSPSKFYQVSSTQDGYNIYSINESSGAVFTSNYNWSNNYYGVAPILVV